MRYLLPSVVILALACSGVSTSPPPAPPAPAPPPPIPEVVTPEPPLAPSPPVARVRPSFPLAVGDHWTWQITRHVGAGLRVLFIPTEPATTGVISTWELTIDSAEADGRFKATRTHTAPEKLPEHTDLVLWLKDGDLWMNGLKGPQPALTMTVPPDAVAPEKVPCVAAFLDGVPGVCSPAPGGPLDVPPGPVYGIVSSDADNGRTLAQILVGIGTAGLLIPGNKAATEYLELVTWKPANPAPTSPAVERWRSSPRPAALASLLPPTREDGAAFIALAKENDRVAVAKAVLAASPVADRPSLARVALSATDEDRLAILGALTPDLGGTPTPAHLDALAGLLVEDDQAAGRALIKGEWPTLQAVLAATEAQRLPALHAAAAANTVGMEEAAVILARFPDSGPALDVLLGEVPAGDRLALLTQASAPVSFDDDRLRLLDGRDELLAASAKDLTGLAALLDTYSFDEGRGKALKKVMDAVQPAQRPPILRVGVERMGFDDGRLAALDAHPEACNALSDRDRAAILAAFPFEKDGAEARLRR